MLATIPYDRAHAVEYARRWALDRNPLFYNFEGLGGDCTNFVSQCVLAGCCVMNYTPDFGWYYQSPDDRAPAWTGVKFFFDFITGVREFSEQNGGVGPFGYLLPRRDRRPHTAVVPGDVIQLANDAGDYYHSLIVTGIIGNDILVASHSDDALDRRLSTYRYSRYRAIHIGGACVDIGGIDCFPSLIAGVPMPEEDGE